jgi:hypothetical protein
MKNKEVNLRIEIIDNDSGKFQGGETNPKPAVPKPSTPPPSQRSVPQDRNTNDKKEK